MAERRVFLAGGVRTPIGKFGGALAGSSAVALAATAAHAALERTKLPLDAVNEAIFGHAR
ncbi:MAG: acetyl-CoA C-acyltransferase, partial [Candidatus Eiseniibacteriota bacterium]